MSLLREGSGQRKENATDRFTMIVDKIEALKKLGRRRKERKPPPGFSDIGEFWNGKYDSDFVTPITKAACNVDSRIALVLQDWASYDGVCTSFNPEVAKYGYLPRLPTNRFLKELLRQTFSLGYEDVFINNLFPHLKRGATSDNIRPNYLDLGFRDFCWPEIQIVKPKLVICLGYDIYKTFTRNLRCPVQKVVAGDYFLYGDYVIYCQSHPGARGRNNRGGTETVLRDWLKMRQVMADRLGQGEIRLVHDKPTTLKKEKAHRDVDKRVRDVSNESHSFINAFMGFLLATFLSAVVLRTLGF